MNRICRRSASPHLAACGNRREAIYEDDEDRRHFLDPVAEVVEHYHGRFPRLLLDEQSFSPARRDAGYEPLQRHENLALAKHIKVR